MKTIKVKFVQGDLATHFTGIEGMVTATFHRGGKNSYEFSFFQDGKPSCVNVEECELSESTCASLGFKGAK